MDGLVNYIVRFNYSLIGFCFWICFYSYSHSIVWPTHTNLLCSHVHHVRVIIGNRNVFILTRPVVIDIEMLKLFSMPRHAWDFVELSQLCFDIIMSNVLCFKTYWQGINLFNPKLMYANHILQVPRMYHSLCMQQEYAGMINLILMSLLIIIY